MNKRLVTTLFAVITAVFMSISAYATVSEPETDTQQWEPIPTVQQLDSLDDLPDSAGQDDIDQSSEALPEATESEEVLPEEDVEEEAAPVKKKSDLPLFVGAGISVLVFGGVVVFCRMKGNH